MHPNPIYRQTPEHQNLDFARTRAFGTLSVNGPDGPLIAHVPFLLSEDGKSADLHLVKSNPIARAASTPLKAVIAVTGADTYISPDWYQLDHQVPTWNYVAVHLRGSLEPLPTDALHDLLDRQSEAFEQRLLPKAPWKTAKMPEDALDRMMRQIVPARMAITSVDGTWKLGQNKPAASRSSAADSAEAAAFGLGAHEIAALMRAVITE